MFRRFDSVLSECLDAMRHGATVQDCLDRFPGQAKRLAPELTLAERVSQTPLVPVRLGAQDQAWHVLQKRVSELQAGKRPKPVHVNRTGRPGWVMPAVGAAVLVLGLSAGTGGVFAASQSAAPNSPLYSVKLAGEDVRLWFVFDDTRKAEILLDQSKQRMEEINSTVREGDPVPDNALSSLEDRNQRAAEIVAQQPENTTLRSHMLTQASDQEDRLLAIWSLVPANAQPQYAQVVTNLHNTRLGGGTGSGDLALRPEELSGGILTITGQAQKGDGDTWTVGGFEVRIDDKTIDHSLLQPGAGASVLVARNSNGRLHALTLSALSSGGVPTSLVTGSVQEITDHGFVVSGQLIPVDDSTLQNSNIQVGQKVQVTLRSTGDGRYVAGSVESAATTGEDETVWFEGTIEGDVSRSTREWKVGGQTFDITANTQFDARAGSAEDGARVQIEAVNNSGTLQAQRVTVLASPATADRTVVLGTFDGFDDANEVWRISGVDVIPLDKVDDPPQGALVYVEASRQGDALAATSVTVIEKPADPPLTQLEGTINQIDSSRWTLEIGQVRVPSKTQLIGKGKQDAAVGKRVMVWVVQGRDGTLEANYARILDESPVTTPAPVISATPTTTPVPSP